MTVKSVAYCRTLRLNSNGIIVCAIMGGFWFGIGLTARYLHFLLPWSTIGVTATGIVILVAAMRFRRKVSGLLAGLREDQRAEAARRPRAFWWTLLAETLLINLSFVYCSRFERMNLFWPLAGLIVSIHFFPLARVFGIAAYNATGVAGAALSLIAIMGIFGHRLAIVGIGMGLVLWCSTVYMLCNSGSTTRDEVRRGAATASICARSRIGAGKPGPGESGT